MAKSAFRELGVSGVSQWGDVPRPLSGHGELYGWTAQRQYEKLRYSDPTGAAMYQVLALPIRGVTWQVTAGGPTADDAAAAALLEDALLRGMSGSFADVIADACSMFVYGWAYLEMVLKRRADGQVGFKKIALRPQWTIQEWARADDGDIVGMVQAQTGAQGVLVPLDRSLLFRTEKIGDAPEGVSIYQPILRTFDYRRRLERVEGVGLFRRWAGLPIFNLPEGASTFAEAGVDSDEYKAEELGKAIYNDRSMAIVLPAGWSMELGGPEGQVDSTMGDTIMRKDAEMARAILAQFLLLGLRSVGTQSLANTLLDTFILAVEGYLANISENLNKYCVPYLFRYNSFPNLTALPKLAPGAVRDADLTQVSQFLQVLLQAGGDLSDVETQAFLRGLVPGMPTEVEGGRAGSAEDAANGDAIAQRGAEEADEVDAAPLRAARGAGGVALFARATGAQRRLERLTDSNSQAGRDFLEGFAGDLIAEAQGLDVQTLTETGLRAWLDEAVLAALLLFRERSVADITAAFWLGLGQPAGGGEVLPYLQQEIAIADRWMGYADGRLSSVNPSGGATLFGDIAGQLEGQIAALLLLLKQRDTEGIAALLEDTVRGATLGYNRGALYSGNVWHAYWRGAVEKERRRDEVRPVRWQLDPLAEHCPTCARFGGDYPSMDALLAVTRGVLPGYGTECDGNCRCSLLVWTGRAWVWA